MPLALGWEKAVEMQRRFDEKLAMSHTGRQSIDTSKVLCVIMGGGEGKRLFPLTKERAKPAVPLAGKYRLVDIPISNCINSHYRQIYLLTQFNSTSLHRHISQSYKFDQFAGGFVEILAAQQTTKGPSWYEGTADAVRKNLVHIMNQEFDYLLILSGDQLYRMDFRQVVARHIGKGADLTVATIPVGRTEAQSLGIMQTNAEGQITRFEEKPKDPGMLDSLRLPPEWHAQFGIQGGQELFLASMGIYVFNREVVHELLDNPDPDFGKHIIPAAIASKPRRVFSYVFQGYWEDIGTIRSFFEANLDLVSELPRFNFFDTEAPIFTRPLFLPGSKVNGATIEHALISDGCIINHAIITNSIVGLRTTVGRGTVLNRVVAMGCDTYESKESISDNRRAGIPPMGIGERCRIENAIIDKNARIGDDVVISPAGKPAIMDTPPDWYIRDGIVIIPKNAEIKNGRVI